MTVHGNVNLILRNGATLKALEGIDVSTPASLTVYAASTDANTMGVLNATCAVMSYGADSYMSGIGGYYNGTVTINGGTVTATGGSEIENNVFVRGGAAIGGSTSNTAGIININGGTITANGGAEASDIGCGWSRSGGTINISGGNITANRSYGIGAFGTPLNSDDNTFINLSWTDLTKNNTSILAKYYIGKISLDREYLFKFDGDDSMTVTTENINGKTIIPKEYIHIPQYTVNFYKNIPGIADEEPYTSQTVYEGDSVQAPEIEDQYITYDGDENEYHYHFINWKYSNGNDFNNSNITENTDLYADWTYIKDGTTLSCQSNCK